MKEQLIQEVQRQMLPYLNNAQLKQLQGVLEGDTLSSHLSHHVIIHSRVGYFQRIHQLVHYGPRLFRRAG